MYPTIYSKEVPERSRRLDSKHLNEKKSARSLRLRSGTRKSHPLIEIKKLKVLHPLFNPSIFLIFAANLPDMTLAGRKTIALLLMFLVVYTSQSIAQTARTAPTPALTDGSFIWQRLNVQTSSEISDLLRQQYDQGRKTGTIPGYRIQLYFGSGVRARSQAEKVRSDFNALYPDTRIYLIFKSPDFIVRAGDFRTKSDALRVLKSLSAGFANAFIVSDEIAFPGSVAQVEIK